jgi:hypothetical protein
LRFPEVTEDVDANELRDLGMPESLLRDNAGTERDDVLATKDFSGTVLIQSEGVE